MTVDEYVDACMNNYKIGYADGIDTTLELLKEFLSNLNVSKDIIGYIDLYRNVVVADVMTNVAKEGDE